MIEKMISVYLRDKECPCLWEESVYINSRIGYSTIVTDKNFKKLNIIYKEKLRNKDYIFLPINVGYHIIEVDRIDIDFEINVYRIKSISEEDMKATIKLIASFSDRGYIVDDDLINISKLYNSGNFHIVVNEHTNFTDREMQFNNAIQIAKHKTIKENKNIIYHIIK